MDTKTPEQEKAERLARAAAAAKALAAKKKAEREAAAAAAETAAAQADTSSAEASDTDAEKTKAERLARAAAAAKALAAKKKAAAEASAKKEETTTTEPASTTEKAKATEKSEQTEASAPERKDKTSAPAASTPKASKDSSEAEGAKDSGKGQGNKALWRSLFAGFILALIATLCTLGVLLTEHDTKDSIEHNRALQEQKLVRSLLPEIMEREEKAGRAVKFECKLISHKLIGNNMRAYIVRGSHDEVLGFISSYSTSRGYSNPLILIGGIDPQGHISKIDVQLSRETPGIGDKVERRRGNFLDQFDGQDLHSIKWDVKKFGGDFDYITGATVTSRALVLATRDFLEVMSSMDALTISQLPDCSI